MRGAELTCLRGKVTISYKLNFFEKKAENNDWASRQIGVYHHRYPQAEGFGNLFILAAGKRRTKFLSSLEKQLGKSPENTPDPSALHLEENPWSLHMALLSCYVDNWRDYFDHLGTKFQYIVRNTVLRSYLSGSFNQANNLFPT